MQYPKAPLKKLTPTMAKINKNKKQTIVTFVIAGSEDSKALTINFIPWFLDIIRRGRRALSALKALTDCNEEAICS